MVCGICSVRWIMKPRPRAARGPRRKRAASRGAWSCHSLPTARAPAGATERRAQVEDGAADEHPGARLVEAALEDRERRHGESGEPAHGELAEDEEEAGAEVRHPSLLIEGTGRDKRAPAGAAGAGRAR